MGASQGIGAAVVEVYRKPSWTWTATSMSEMPSILAFLPLTWSPARAYLRGVPDKPRYGWASNPAPQSRQGKGAALATLLIRSRLIAVPSRSEPPNPAN